ncbi:Receptor-like kinase [Dirofilaria immitis]
MVRPQVTQQNERDASQQSTDACIHACVLPFCSHVHTRIHNGQPATQTRNPHTSPLLTSRKSNQYNVLARHAYNAVSPPPDAHREIRPVRLCEIVPID